MVVTATSRFLVTADSFEDVLQLVASSVEVVVDTETTGLWPWHGDRLCGVGIAVNAEDGYYFPFRHPKDNLDFSYLERLWEVLRQVPRLIGYNLKFDLAIMFQDGYDPPTEQQLSDVIVAARMCASERFPDLTLSSQLEKHVALGAAEYEREFKAYLKRNKWSKSYHLAPADKVGFYCVGDVVGTWKLKDAVEAIIEDTVQGDVWDQEQEQTHTLWQMEREGMGYDEEYGALKIPQLKARIVNLYNEAYAIAGRKFNFNSNPQLTEVMRELGIKSSHKSVKTGNESWDNGVLLGIEHPIAGKIVEIRGLEKMLGTYFVGITSWPNARVHGQFKNWGAVTGRLSAAKPNLQNIAKTVQNLHGNSWNEEALAAVTAFLGARGSSGSTHTDASVGDGKVAGGVTLGGMMAVGSGFEDNDESVSVRRLFVGQGDYRLYFLDYSQMEIRVFSDYVRDPNLAELLETSSFDFHSHVAMTVWNIDLDNSLWDFYRTLAKAINFGLIYGIGIKKLASQIQKSETEARQYRQEYFDQFPKAKTFIAQVIDVGERRGYIFNRFRRRYWIDPNRAYVGVNYLIQGTSADIVKNRMNACQRFIREEGLKSKMLAQVHDEIIFEIHNDEESWVPFEMQRIMEDRQIETYLPVEISRGNPSWAEKSTWDAEKKVWKDK